MNTRTRKLTKKIRKKTGRYKMKGGFENPLHEIDPEEAKAKLESDKEELAKYMMSMNPASQGSSRTWCRTSRCKKYEFRV